MNNSPTTIRAPRTPGWAYLFGWWFILLAIQKMLPVASSLIEWFFFRNGQISIPPSHLNTTLPFLYGLFLITAGIYLMRKQAIWRWIIISVCIFMIADTILSDFILQGGLHWLLSPVAGPDWCGVILPPVRTLLFSSLMIWFSFRRQEPDHSIIAPVSIFLVIAGFSAMISPLNTLQFHFHIARSFGTSSWEMMTLGLWKIGLEILAPLLIILSALVIRKHPRQIRIVAAVLWFIGLLFAIHKTEPVWSTLLSPPLTNLDMWVVLSLSQYRLPPAIAMLIPAIMTNSSVTSIPEPLSRSRPLNTQHKQLPPLRLQPHRKHHRPLP